VDLSYQATAFKDRKPDLAQGGQSKSLDALSLLDPTQLTLEAGMRGAWMRQTLLTNNIANADTPGYQREDVNFQATLRSAMESGESALQEVQFQPEVKPGTAGPEGNGVNIDEESAQVAENGLDYQAMTQVLGARDTILRSAMGVN
jgi:flagellar basal-body rod protein FlgB